MWEPRKKSTLTPFGKIVVFVAALGGAGTVATMVWIMVADLKGKSYEGVEAVLTWLAIGTLVLVVAVTLNAVIVDQKLIRCQKVLRVSGLTLALLTLLGVLTPPLSDLIPRWVFWVGALAATLLGTAGLLVRPCNLDRLDQGDR